MTDKVWNEFFQKIQAHDEQQQQFKQFYALLQEYNAIHNLTAITDFQKILEDHFEDSLALSQCMDLTKIKTLADIGTGAGFPGVPLKIMYPQLKVTLIEVNQKKVHFLHSVIEQLQLADAFVIDVDWRTFLRSCDEDIEIFCARASLQPEELIRVFMPSSCYKDSQLVYWASMNWKPTNKVAKYIIKEQEYAIGQKKRRLIFLGLNKELLKE
jgi:16S rRNA (guanine(527)-N(7))-methyltransferase RsmG